MEKKGGGSERHSYSNKKSRKPTGNSGLFGRARPGGMQAGGEAIAPPTRRARRKPTPTASSLSKVQQNMLKQAQLHARGTGQNPDKLKALTAKHGNLLKSKEGRRAMLKGAPAPGGMQAGGAVPPPLPPQQIGQNPTTVAPGTSGLSAPASPSAAVAQQQRQAMLGAAPGQSLPPPPPQAGGGSPPPPGTKLPPDTIPQLPGGGRLTPPVSGPNPDAGRMQPRRPDAMFKSIRDSLGGPPRPRRGR